jgi:predicted NBD/HSP70 family sugar kinase
MSTTLLKGLVGRRQPPPPVLIDRISSLIAELAAPRCACRTCNCGQGVRVVAKTKSAEPLVVVGNWRTADLVQVLTDASVCALLRNGFAHP